MRITAIFAILFAVVALLVTGIFVLANWNPNPGIGLLWKFITFWPATFINVFVGIFNDPASFLTQGIFIYITLVVQIGAMISTALLARSLDRPSWDWTLATFVFPFAAPFFLAVAKEH